MPILQRLLIDEMQNTRFKKLLDSLWIIIQPFINDSWSRRSIFFLALLSGFYFTNSLISFLLDRSVNTIFLSITILIIMELTIQSLTLSKLSRFSLIIYAVNNFRIGSTYALILEAFKLGS